MSPIDTEQQLSPADRLFIRHENRSHSKKVLLETHDDNVPSSILRDDVRCSSPYIESPSPEPRLGNLSISLSPVVTSHSDMSRTRLETREGLDDNCQDGGDDVADESREEVIADDATNEGLSDEELKRREEEEESIALARMLMQQEAMESYAMSANFLRQNESNFDPDDLAAVQAALAEEDPMSGGVEGDEEYEDEDRDGDEEYESQELSYDAMLRLGEQIGDVKSERWSFVAKRHIEKLPQFKFVPSAVKEKDENDCNVKCLVCQCQYEKDEALRRLPCGHCFHTDCVDEWLMSKDFCPYCRQSIVRGDE